MQNMTPSVDFIAFMGKFPLPAMIDVLQHNNEDNSGKNLMGVFWGLMSHIEV